VIDWHKMSPQEIERRATSIAPGEWAVDMQRPICTLLGSCVAVCLYDPAVGVGGMNHFMLPNMRKREGGVDVDSLLSGDYAMEVLLNGILARGGARHRLKAKAFGGGTIISGIAASGIGKRNAEFTRDWLAREGIELVASDFLGACSRKVLLVPATGDAYCRRMTTTMANAQEVARAELAYAESLRKPPPKSNVELF
jgi:chemotaxis protein CheD